MVDEPALTSLDRLKHLFPGFASNNPSHRVWALQFLMELWEVLFVDSALKGLKSDRDITVWFDQEPNPIVIKTINELRTTNSSRDRLLLYPSDVVQILVDLANALKVPNNGSNYYFSNALTDGDIREHSVLDTQTITELLRLYSEIRLKLSRLNSKTDEKEKEAEEDKTETEEAKKPAEAPTSSVATAKVGPVPEGDGAGAEAEEAPTAPTDEIPPTSPFHNESFITAVRNRNENREFAWIYNHTVFDLLGRHGITEIDESFRTTLSVEVRTYLRSLSPQQLADLFANPVGRMAVVTIIYQRLSAQPDFVGRLRAQFENHIEKLPEAERQTFIVTTGFDSANTIEKQLTQLLTQKPDFVTQNPIAEIEKSLAQLIGLKKIDGSVAINFEQSAQALVSLASSEADLFRLIDQLTPEAIAITFFPNPNNPNVPDPSMLVQIKQNLTLIRSLLKNSLKVVLVDKIANKPPGLNQEPGLSVALTGDSVDNISTSDATVTAIRTLSSAMPSGSSRTATEEALTNDESVSHTQVLMELYQTRIQKIWLQLDERTQLKAYLRLYNMTDSPENEVVLLDKVKHLRIAETGSLPWNPSMFGLINWETFLRKAKKSELLHQHELDEGEKKALVAQKAHLKATNDARALAATGFTTDLSSQQVIQLQYSTLFNQLEEAVVFAEGVAQRLKNPTEVSELEYRSALAALERVNTRIQLLKQQEPTGVSEDFSSNLKKQIDDLATTQHSVLQLILAQWPGNPLVGGKQNKLEQSHDEQTTDQELTLSSQITLVETYEAIITYQAPTLLLPTVIILEQQGFSPDAPLIDTVDQQTLLPEPNTASLASLGRGAKRNNSLTPNRLEQINAASQGNQSFNDLKNVASGVGEVAAQSKGNWVLAAGLGIKKYFTDKEFRQSINRTAAKYSKKAALLGGILLGGGVLVGLLLRNLLGLVGKFGGLAAGAAAGGAIGMAFGGPLGALVGAGIGGYIGYSAGAKAAAFNAASGAELISPGTASSTVGAGTASAAPPMSQGAIQSSASPSSFSSNSVVNSPPQPGAQFGGQSTLGSTAGPISSVGDAGAAIPTAATVSTSAPFLGTALGIPLLALIPGGSMLILAMITLYTMFVIFSAFLTPLPVGNLGGINSTQSEYATLTKRASPTDIADGQTAAVIYKVTLQSRSNYRIKVTAVTDTANTGFTFQSSRATHVNPQVSPPASLLNPRISLADFSTVYENQTQEKEYTVTFTGGKQVLVSNTVTITYDVQDAQGGSVATGKTLSATANVNIGDHGVACWPASGQIWQLPGGSFSHRPGNGLILDAYDIGAVQGTNIYTPFDGWAQTGDFPPRRSYGKFVVVDSYVRGHWIRLIYGHFMSTAITARASDGFSNVGVNHDSNANNNVGQAVTAGQLLGKMDDTGYSFGSHLHYELMFIDGVRHSLSPGDPLTLEDLVPRPAAGHVREGDNVRTCYQ